MRQFKVSLWNGTEWLRGTYEEHFATTAALRFLEEHAPSAELFSLRWEQPGEGGRSVWSAGTSEHGQRVWIREQP